MSLIEPTTESAPERPRRNRPLRKKGAAFVSRTRRLARLSAMPDDPGEAKHVVFAVLLLRGARRLLRRIQEDRLNPRAAALAFFTLLAFIPMAAVTVAVLRLLGFLDNTDEILQVLVRRYFPQATKEVASAIAPLLAEVRFETVGIIGLLALLPIALTLMRQVELAMTDIFRTPKPKRIKRLLSYSALVILAPMVAMLTVRYTPDLTWVTFLDRHLGPTLVTGFVLFLAFRFLPGTRIRNRSALAGAASAALLMSIAKAGFQFWASEFAGSMHLVWGAVAFVPMLLIWVFLVWFLALLGAEIAAVIEALMHSMHAPPRAKRVRMTAAQRRRVRARRTLRRRHERLQNPQSARPPAHSAVSP